MKNKRLYALSLVAVLLFGLLVGCGGQSALSPKAAEPAKSREITDMVGRSMTVPTQIDKVFAGNSEAAVYLYTIEPDRLLGWTYPLNDLEKRFILPQYQTLTAFGMQDNVNYEAVIAAGPQIALMVGNDSKGVIATADKLSDSLNIPVVIISDKLEDCASVYRFLGDLLGIAQRAEELATYTDQTFADIEAVDIPPEERITVYYGNGVDSLETAPRGSVSAQVIDMVKAVNVAATEGESGGRVKVSLEQVLAWNPDVIIVNGEPKQDMTGNHAAQAILESPDYAHIQAVQSKKVFGVPKAPFSWIDRPPGPNRILGMRWLAAELYPDYFDYQLEEDVRSFYKLFYHTDLTDEQLAGLFRD
ncbi:MAG: ABC transporter substrate-binding protein [Oscillospiraceae bacterium]|jgi:iron complex transport system substrate-binding protein